MSNAIAQSAAVLTQSANGEDNFDFQLAVKTVAERSAKGITRESKLLNRNKLVAGACAQYRARFAAIYGKTDRLPSEIFNKIESAVDEFIDSTLKQVNSLNSISLRRAFYHKSNDLEVVERVTVIGENKLSLKEQKLGVTLMIGQAEKRLKDLEAKPTPDLDREKQVKQTIMKLTVTQNFIIGEMKSQEKLAEETKQ